MGQAPQKRQTAPKLQTYEVTLDSGETYQIQAPNDQVANDLGDFIKQQVAAGNPQLENVQLPHSAAVQRQQAQQIEGLPYKNSGDVADLVSGAETHPEVDRSGFLDYIDAGVRGLTSGALLNFDDELVSGMNALVPLDKLTGIPVKSVWDGSNFWDAFNHNMNIEKQITQADENQHGFLRGTGQVVGGVSTALAAAPERLALMGAAKVAPRAVIPLTARAEAAALAAPVRSAVARGTAQGAGYGYVSGFGAGDTLENRQKSAGMGAVGGAALGGTLSGTITGLGPAVARYAGVLLGRGNDREAVRQIVTSLARDGFDVTSPTGVQALRTELQQFTGKPVSLADIGSATRARAGVGLRSPSAVQQQSVDAVTARGQGQGARLASDVRANVAPRTDVHALDDALVAQREAEAMPLRDQALFERQVTPPEMPPLPVEPFIEEATDAGLMRMLGQSSPAVGKVKPMDRTFIEQMQARAAPEAPAAAVPAEAVPFGPPAPTIVDRAARMVDDPVLNQLANEHPLAQRALGGAVTLSQSERSLKQMLGQPLDDVPEILAGQPLDYRTADYLKRFLDQQVNRLYRGNTETFTAAEAGQVKALRDAIRERMRTTNPEYGDYLDAYRGSSEMIDALGDGRGYRALDPEQIAAGQAGRSTAAQELYRVGAARDLLDTLNTTGDGRNPATRILNSPESRAQLEATGVTPDAMGRLTRSVGQERQLNLLNAELAGSQTDARIAARADADAGVSAALPFNPGSPFGWLGAAARGVINRASTARNAAVNEAALPRLLETDPAAVERIIGELEAGGQRLQAEQLRRALRANQTSRSLGAIIGAPVALQEGN